MKVDRRKVLQTTVAVLAATSLAKLARKTGTLTLVDATLSERELRAAGASSGLNAGTIQPDLVRQWRDGLGVQIASAENVTAYVRWDKALLLIGLARESRIAYRTVQLDRSVFAVRLSSRA
jgi:hypothetical protein